MTMKRNLRMMMMGLSLFLTLPVRIWAEPSGAWRSATWFPAGPGGSMAVRDGYVWIINGWTRGDAILVFDAQAPDTPRFVSGLPGRGYLYLRGGTFHGDVFYVPATWFSVMVVDVSDMTRPHMTRNLFLNFPGGDAECLDVDGDRLYVGGRGGGLRIFDVSQPGAPMLVAWAPQFAETMVQIVVSGHRMVLRPRRGEAILATVTNDEILEQSRLRLGGHVRLLGSALYESTRRELIVHDVSAMDEPEASVRIPGVSPVGMPAPDRMLMRGPEAALTLFDVSNPLKPVPLNTIRLPDDVTAGQMAVDGDILYVMDSGRYSLRIFDLSGDEAAQPLGERFIMRNAGNLALGSDGYVFLSHAQGGLTTVLTMDADSRGPTDFAARLAHSGEGFRLHDTHNAAAVVRIGNYLLSGDGVVDVSDPLAPVMIHPRTRAAADIAVRGDLAALAQGDRLTLLDVSQLPQRVVLGEYRPGHDGDHFAGVALGDGMAYVVNRAAGQSRIDVLDIRESAQIRRMGQCDVPTSIVVALHEGENLLYVPGASGGGMTLVDVSDPSEPRVLTTIEGLLDTSCYRIRIHDGNLYYTDSMRGIKVADLADPRRPVLRGTHMGTTRHLASYTDFEIRDQQLYGLRYSHLDVWELAGE